MSVQLQVSNLWWMYSSFYNEDKYRRGEDEVNFNCLSFDYYLSFMRANEYDFFWVQYVESEQ